MMGIAATGPNRELQRRSKYSVRAATVRERGLGMGHPEAGNAFSPPLPNGRGSVRPVYRQSLQQPAQRRRLGLRRLYAAVAGRWRSRF